MENLIFVTSYGKFTQTLNCLRSLDETMTIKEKSESKIILLNNFFNLETLEQFQQLEQSNELSFNIDFIYFEENIGLFAALNQGIKDYYKLNSNQMLVLIDNDLYRFDPPGWLTIVRKFLENNPDVGICSSMFNAAKKVFFNSIEETKIKYYFTINNYGQDQLICHKGTEKGRLESVPRCNHFLCFQPNLFDQLGSFDELVEGHHTYSDALMLARVRDILNLKIGYLWTINHEQQGLEHVNSKEEFYQAYQRIVTKITNDEESIAAAKFSLRYYLANGTAYRPNTASIMQWLDHEHINPESLLQEES